MKFKIKRNQNSYPWPADAEFEWNGFGEKIMTFPEKMSFVKDVRGIVRKKAECEPFRRDHAGNYYYVHISDTARIEEIRVLEETGDMKPSTWKEDWPDGKKPF